MVLRQARSSALDVIFLESRFNGKEAFSVFLCLGGVQKNRVPEKTGRYGASRICSNSVSDFHSSLLIVKRLYTETHLDL